VSMRPCEEGSPSMRSSSRKMPVDGCSSTQPSTCKVGAARKLSFAIAFGVFLPTLAAWSADLKQLPEGPDRELVSKVCQTCHELQLVLDAAGISREEWDMSLDEMTTNGMNLSPGERSKILGYLSTYLGPAPPNAATPQ
jgi:hypothetical protein